MTGSPLPCYRVMTLGCKLNQFDSASIEGQLRVRGFTAAGEGDPAGVVVINTCAVTENAEREARRLARRARRENPGCRLIVTGCYAELDPRRLSEMEEIDAVVGHTERDRLPELLDGIAREAGATSVDIACIEAAGDLPALHFGERTRAFLKIQEGCDLSCSYCIIPRVRGRSRSIPEEQVLAALTGLVKRGFREIVLTGVNTGDYGKDLVPRTNLASLLRTLLRAPRLGRLRLNSLEPRTVTPEIIRILKDDPRLSRHLQVPLQSGCDRILRMMYRNYRTTDYRKVLETLRSEVPEIGLGANVIVGFPGETESDFEETCGFVESSPLNYLHVFSYSDRPGTPASRMDGHVPPDAVRHRSARLRALGAALGLSFRRSLIGETLPVLVFHEKRPDGRFRALSDNFVDMGIAVDATAANRIIPARIVSADELETIAIPAA